MTNAPKNRNLMVVELDKGVRVCTPIPSQNHAALRSGFAGYTANPRWNASKFRAWRIGRQWRDAVNTGKMTVRQDDSMLVPASEMACDVKRNTEQSSPKRWNLPERLRLKSTFASMS